MGQVGCQQAAYRRMGFFEVIENRDAAFILFDTAREWLDCQRHGSNGWSDKFR